MLTRRQHALLIFISAHMKETGVAPSFDEMMSALNLRSKSGIHRMLRGLEERGAIRRLSGRARAIEIISHAVVRCSKCGHVFEVGGTS